MADKKLTQIAASIRNLSIILETAATQYKNIADDLDNLNADDSTPATQNSETDDITGMTHEMQSRLDETQNEY